MLNQASEIISLSSLLILGIIVSKRINNETGKPEVVKGVSILHPWFV
jgi:hypothetical protein